MKMKKILGVAAIALTAITLASCGSKSQDKTAVKSDKTVTVWAWDETFNIKAVKEAVKLYDNDDVKIDVVTMAQDDIVQKLNTSLASGSTSGLPNIVLIEDVRIPGYLSSYPDAFSDLSSIVKEGDFSKYKFGGNKVNNKIYGVPFDSGVAGIYYRRDYLKEAGYEEAALQDINWNDLIKIAKDVKAKTGHPFVALNPSDLGVVDMIMQSAGKWYTGEDGKTVTLKGNDALKYGLEIYAEMLKSGIVEETVDWDSGVNAVQSGKVGSAIMGCWYSSTITGAADQSGKWGIAPLPVIKGNANSVHASNSGGAGWYVIKGVKGEGKAKDFLKQTFASSVPLMENLAKEIGLVSTLKAAGESSVYQEPNEFYGGQKTLADFSKWSSEIPAINYGQNTREIQAVVAESLQKILAGESAESAIADAQKQVEAQLAN